MDMTLYALLMKRLQGQEECLTWNGHRVEVVEAMPESPLPEVIYFVKSDIAVEDFNIGTTEPDSTQQPEGAKEENEEAQVSTTVSLEVAVSEKMGRSLDGVDVVALDSNETAVCALASEAPTKSKSKKKNKSKKNSKPSKNKQ